MAFSKYNKDRPFLVITQVTTPAEGENTSEKNWKEKLQEMVLIVDKVKDKHMRDATIIIDILQRKIVKSRFDEDDADVITHYLTQYKSQVAEGIQIWMANMSSDEKAASGFIEDLSEEMEKYNDIPIDVKIDDKTLENAILEDEPQDDVVIEVSA